MVFERIFERPLERLQKGFQRPCKGLLKALQRPLKGGGPMPRLWAFEAFDWLKIMWEKAFRMPLKRAGAQVCNNINGIQAKGTRDKNKF